MTTTSLSEVLAKMREWGNGEGCFNDNPEGEPLPCVFYTKQAWDELCNRIESALASAEPVASVSGDFIRRTNEDYAAWCKATYVADSLDERGFRSLDGLWAWQEQERRKTGQPAAKVEAPAASPSAIVPRALVKCSDYPNCPNLSCSACDRAAELEPTPASVPDGWAMVPRVATSAMISSGWESGKRVGDTRIIISVSGVWDAMISTAAAHNTPASDYALCCDTPAYCSSVRRCTATDAVSEGWGRIPQSITEADAPPHYIPSEKRAYAAGFNWCVAAAQTTMTANPPANQEGTTHDHR